VLRGKSITIGAYIKKPETSQINKLMMYLKLLEKQKQTKPQTNRWREIRTIRTKIKKIESNKLYKDSRKQKVGSLKKLTRLTNP
jgi:hypothetical protein